MNEKKERKFALFKGLFEGLFLIEGIAVFVVEGDLWERDINLVTITEKFEFTVK